MGKNGHRIFELATFFENERNFFVKNSVIQKKRQRIKMDYFKKRTQKKPNKKNNPNKKNEQLKTIQTSLIKLLFFTERMNFLLQNEQFVEQNF